LTTVVELWKGRGRRRLYGEWLSAVQPVYYPTEKWHVQKIQIKPTIFGLVVETIESPGKLQWRMYAKLEDKTFFVGRWKSVRPGSVSNGYMSMRISSNGKYMCGHDYGADARHGESHFGILLLGRSRSDLKASWKAMFDGTREMLPLSEEIDFP
jgi:hypothetical protein